MQRLARPGMQCSISLHSHAVAVLQTTYVLLGSAASNTVIAVLSAGLLLLQPPQLRADKVGARPGRQRPAAAAAVAEVTRAAGGRRKGKDHGSEVGAPPCCACSCACVCQHLLDLQPLVQHAQLCCSGHAAVAGTACVFARLPTLTYCGNVCPSELAPNRHAA
jgi:hypothetical protein